MKKILSFVLCAAMLLSLGTLAISAEKIDGTTTNLLYATYGTADVTDGLKNDAMQLSAPQNFGTTPQLAFGACWDESNLYIGATGFIPTRVHYDSSSCPTARPIALSRIYASFECGTNAGFNKEGVPNGSAIAASKEASRTITATDFYSGDKNYTGSFYGEFALPLSHLNFYDLGDGSLATRVTLTYVKDNGNGSEGAHTSTNFILVLTDVARSAGIDGLGKSNTYTSDYTTGMNGARVAGSFADQGLVRICSNSGANKSGRFCAAGSANTAFVAGVASVAELDLQFNAIVSSAGPNAAESWSNEGVWAGGANVTGSNPQRVVITVMWNKNGDASAMMAGYAIYNVGGEIRLYPATATSANDPYIVIPDVVIGASPEHAQFRQFFKLRLEFDAQYNLVVKKNDRVLGSLDATASAYSSSHALAQYAPSELSVYVISGGESTQLDVSIRNPYIAQQSSAAVAALAARGNSFTVYGDQHTAVTNETFSVRFLAELPATLADYTKLAYDVVITNNNGTAKTTVDLTRVYTSVSNDTTGHDGLKAVVALRGIDVNDGECTITVTPWVVTAVGGEKLYGDSYTVTYTWDGTNLTYTYPQ